MQKTSAQYNNNLNFTCTKNAPEREREREEENCINAQIKPNASSLAMLMRANCVKLFFNCVLPVISNFIVIFYFSITS